MNTIKEDVKETFKNIGGFELDTADVIEERHRIYVTGKDTRFDKPVVLVIDLTYELANIFVDIGNNISISIQLPDNLNVYDCINYGRVTLQKVIHFYLYEVETWQA